jgi:hypothetical protein
MNLLENFEESKHLLLMVVVTINPRVATLKVVVHVPIKRYGMLWGFQSLHMNDGWYPFEGGREG